MEEIFVQSKEREKKTSRQFSVLKYCYINPGKIWIFIPSVTIAQ